MLDKEMMAWSYKEAEQFFENPNVPDDLKLRYVKSLGEVCVTELLFECKKPLKKIRKAIKKSTLVFVDGPSCSGKSTLVDKLSDYFDAIVVDSDKLATIGYQNYQSSRAFCYDEVKTFEEIDKLTDDYVVDQIEGIVAEASTQNKPVILVGTHINLISRAIIVNTLGKYFENIVSLFCFEPDTAKFTQAANKRFWVKSKNFESKYHDELYIDMFREYDRFVMTLKHVPDYLGRGVQYSFILNYSAIERIK